MKCPHLQRKLMLAISTPDGDGGQCFINTPGHPHGFHKDPALSGIAKPSRASIETL